MGSDLTNAFGVPATDLTSRLGRNPRRERRERLANSAPPASPPAENGDDAAEAPSATVARDEAELSSQDTTDVSQDTTDVSQDTAGVAGMPGSPASPEPDRSSSSSGGGGSARRSGGTATARRGSGTRAPRGGRAPQNLEIDANISYPVPVYIHPAVRAAASSQRKDSKLTNAEIAFNAIDDVQHRLPGLIRDRRLQARPDTSLFPGRVRRGRLAGGGAATSAGEARRVIYQFRATEAELEIIDRLVSENGAESRSELIAVAMEESLLRGR